MKSDGGLCFTPESDILKKGSEDKSREESGMGKSLTEEKDRNKKRITFWSMTGAGIIVFFCLLIYSHMPLDKLQEYQIQVEVNRDGTMDITYHFRWEVLNDSKEGPLTWVKLGIPNASCQLVDYGGDISGLHRENYRDGLIQFDLDRSYYKGDVADFYFTIRQEDMLCRNEEEPALPFYDFTPGWFDGMQVEHYLFEWEGSPAVRKNNADRTEGNTLLWEGKLKKGEKRQMLVYYDEKAFQDPALTDWAPVSGNVEGEEPTDLPTLLIIPCLLVFLGYRISYGRDSYGNGRGYHGGYHGGHGGGCACACAGCACACACAGGGRAGCSKKDFYRGMNAADDKEGEKDGDTQ